MDGGHEHDTGGLADHRYLLSGRDECHGPHDVYGDELAGEGSETLRWLFRPLSLSWLFGVVSQGSEGPRASRCTAFDPKGANRHLPEIRWSPGAACVRYEGMVPGGRTQNKSLKAAQRCRDVGTRCAIL